MNKPGAKRGRASSFVVNDSTNVRVYVRVRPFNKRERELGHASKCGVMVDGKQAYMMDTESGVPKDERFTFDDCFWSNSDVQSANPFIDQAGVYDVVGSAIIENAFKGYHSCLFAYGQTGSGKTFTMMGDREKQALWGMIPRLCNGLFEKIAGESGSKKEFKVEVAYIEIYNEMLQDLLGNKGFGDVKIKDHPIYGPSVDGNKLAECKTLDDIMTVMGKGDHRRTVAATNMNATSSRSHAVFTVMFTQKLVDGAKQQQWFSKINLIDLAGSERVEDSGVSGDQLKEAININKSLTTLGRVMDALVELSQGKKNIVPPYRESMLTRMLQDSLGGNSKTMMFANVSPSPVNYEETLSTLRYSSRARNIVNQAKVNSVSTGGMAAPPPEPEPEPPKEDPRIAEMESARRDLEDQMNRLQSEKSALDTELSQLRSAVSAAEDSNSNLTSTVNKANQELQRYTSEKDRADSERARLKEEYERLNNERDADGARAKSEIDSLRQELEKIRAETATHQTSGMSIKREIEDIQRQIAEQRSKHDSQAKKIIGLQQRYETEAKKSNTYDADMNNLRQSVEFFLQKDQPKFPY